MIIEPTRNNSFHPQQANFHAWLESYIIIKNMNEDQHAVSFATIYSALNSLSWLYSSSIQDKKMLLDFSKFFFTNYSDDLSSLITKSKEIINYTKLNFENMHMLQTRDNDKINGEVISFHLNSNTKKTLSEITVEELSDKQCFLIAINILYQYRCNLVHGNKSFNTTQNTELCNKLTQLIIEIFLKLPEEIIPINISMKLKLLK